MSASALSAPEFHSERSAYEFVEAKLWPNGPICPHCGSVGRAYELKGKTTRIGLRKCGHCRKQFTVKVGTIFEDSHVPLNKWLQALHLLCSSKKGSSSHQLHRILGVQLKTAWFMAHRIREAMRDGTLGPLGGVGGTVEADETYHGKTAEKVSEGTRGPANKRPVVGLVQRGGKVRTFHVERADKATVAGIVRENVARETAFMTDESRLYTEVGGEMASHETVCHSAEEYVRGEAHTNTIEGYFSIFKRGMKGVYQHCAEKHLHRYLAEFDFRYNHRSALGVEDADRADAALLGVVGKRLATGSAQCARQAQQDHGPGAGVHGHTDWRAQHRDGWGVARRARPNRRVDHRSRLGESRRMGPDAVVRGGRTVR
jgi:transposase-like protein